MKRQISALIFVLLMALSITAGAAEPRSTAPRLYFRGTTAHCEVSIDKAGSIEATITLWQGSTYIQSWEESGSNSINFSGTAGATKGKTYTLTVDYTVNGKSQPQLSASATC